MLIFQYILVCIALVLAVFTLVKPLVVKPKKGTKCGAVKGGNSCGC